MALVLFFRGFFSKAILGFILDIISVNGFLHFSLTMVDLLTKVKPKIEKGVIF